VSLTGGIHTRIFGLTIQSRDPFRALALSFILFVIAAARDRGAFADALTRLTERIRRHSPLAALAIAALLGAHATVFGAFGVAGADAYGYINQAYQWKNGVLPAPIPLTMDLRIPDGDEMQIPFGYRGGQQPHTMVPTYAPGLPLIMAVTLFLSGCGPYFVTPVCAVLLVWFTFCLGSRAGGRICGLLAAVLVAVTPVVLFQALWPMSDVPVGAFWTATLFYATGGRRQDVIAAADYAFLALLIRPNLVPLAAVPFAATVLTIGGRERWPHAVMFSAPVVFVAAFIAWLNTIWYGAPSNTGYGATREIYLLPNVAPNIRLYTSWLIESQSFWVLVALVPLVPFFGRRANRPTIAICAVTCVVAFALYATYSQFEAWWYLRFLLPAYGAFSVLLAAGLTTIARALPHPYGRVAALGAVLFMSATMLSFAADKGVFGRIKEGERRYIYIGDYLARSAPENAALFSSQHSGSLRYYTGRVTLRFDSVKPETAGDVVPAIERVGYHPYLVVDDWEIPQVRTRFGLAPDASLPWTIAARMREHGGVTVYDMGSAPLTSSPVAIEPRSDHWCEARHPISGRRSAD
jgi:hypothetical protein